MEQKKQIKAEVIRKAVRAARNFWETGDVKHLEARRNYCKSLATQLGSFRTNTFVEIIDGIVESEKITGNKTLFQTIYKIFELLGYEVVNEVK